MTLLTLYKRLLNENVEFKIEKAHLRGENIDLKSEESVALIKKENIDFALEVTLRIHFDELKKWDNSAYTFMQLMSYLPSHNYKRDLKLYWIK